MKAYTILNANLVETLSAVKAEAIECLAAYYADNNKVQPTYTFVAGKKKGEWYFGIKGLHEDFHEVTGYGHNLAEAIHDFAYVCDNIQYK